MITCATVISHCSLCSIMATVSQCLRALNALSCSILTKEAQEEMMADDMHTYQMDIEVAAEGKAGNPL
jgi:hypothetical protein